MFENAFHPISPSCHSSSLLSADPACANLPANLSSEIFPAMQLRSDLSQMPMALLQFLGTPFNLSHLGLHPPHHI